MTERARLTIKNKDIGEMPNLDFLKTVLETKVPLNIFLTNGVKLTGQITGYDKYTILLKHFNTVSLVYKSAISTILPNKSELL